MSAASTETSDISRIQIAFPNGNHAVLVRPLPESSPESIVSALGIGQPQTVVLLSGGAGGLEDAMRDSLRPLFTRGIARAAADLNLVIVDGGTQAGVMSLMGQGVADRGHTTPLIGIAPTGKVTYPGAPNVTGVTGAVPLEPNHSHFVLVEASEWGGETATLIAVAEAFKAPVVVILASGGDVARREILLAVRKNWPIIVLKGSGRLADALADLCETKPPVIPDQALDEIVSEGNIRVFPPMGTLEDLEQLIATQTSNRPLLKQAWQRFATLDSSAELFQGSFKRLQLALITIGVSGVLLAVVQKEVQLHATRIGVVLSGPVSANPPNLVGWAFSYYFLRYCLIVIPIVTSVLLAISHRLRQGNKWVLLRASAEGIKREIYAYRARAGKYGARELGTSLREDKFEEALENVTRRLARTELNRTAVKTYTGEPPAGIKSIPDSDDAYSWITPARYIELRLDDQLAYFQSKTVSLERQLRWLQILILVAGAVGTLLAAIHLELWIAVTTSLATAFTSFLAYQQTEQTLVQYNQTVTDLENLKSWWTKLTPAERRDAQNVDRLIEFTEKALEAEMVGWGQRMEDALEKLRAPGAKPDSQDFGDSTQLRRDTTKVVKPDGKGQAPNAAGRTPLT